MYTSPSTDNKTAWQEEWDEKMRFMRTLETERRMCGAGKSGLRNGTRRRTKFSHSSLMYGERKKGRERERERERLLTGLG
jgi:hypothetical protein